MIEPLPLLQSPQSAISSPQIPVKYVRKDTPGVVQIMTNVFVGTSVDRKEKKPGTLVTPGNQSIRVDRNQLSSSYDATYIYLILT
jgi:hypothetical protein